MNTVISVDLAGQTHPVRLHEDAYEALRGYLARARAQLGTDAADAVDDIERSIGERLTGLAGLDDRVLSSADVRSVLDDIGAVDSGPSFGSPIAATSGSRPRTRRLYRIREGQQLAGVCTGLAAYSDIRLDWVRTIFFFATFLTVGGFLVVYLVLAFVLPIVDTKAEWLALMEAESARVS